MCTLQCFRNLSRNLKPLLVGFVLASAAGSSSRAAITNATAYGYSSAIYCYPTFNDASDLLRMSMNQTAAGQLGGYIYTDSLVDPTLTLQHVINNSTGIAWSSYHVSIFMPNIFTIGSDVVNAPPGWSSAVTAPVAVAGGFQGKVDLSGGPLVAPGGTLDFQFAITFANGLVFSFTEDAAPGLVPEPSSLSLALLGLAAFRLLKSRRLA